MGAERNSNFFIFYQKAVAEAETPFVCDAKRFDLSIIHPQAEEKEVSNAASISPPSFS